MSNDFFNISGFPLSSQDGRSVDMRAELLAFQAAFDKMPAMAGNGTKSIEINSAGNALIAAPGVNAVSTPWTPVLTATTPGNLVVAYNTQSGDIVRKNGITVVRFEIITSTFTHTTASGNLIISGFTVGPFAGNAYGTLAFSGLTKATYTQFTLNLASGGSQATILASGSGVALATCAITDLPTTGTVHLKGSIMYGVNG